MTIDEAIKILSDAKFGSRWPEPKSERDAIKLGIEALREVKESRFDPSTYISHRLPGETEE